MSAIPELVIPDAIVAGQRPLVPPTPPRVIGRTVLCGVEYGGADPTGATDSTAAIQKAIDALPAAGGEVSLPEGEFLIDPTVGIQFRSNFRLRMTMRTVLRLKANDQPRYGGLGIKNVEQIEVVGGKIIGDRDQHTYTPQKIASKSTHEWGHGLQLYGCSHVTIKDTIIRDCTGDGMSMSATSDHKCDDILVLNVTSTRNRRQGCSIGKATNVRIIGGEISYTEGTLPMCGIDIEPENGGEARNIVIAYVHIHHNHANAILGLQRGNVDSPVSDILVTKCVLEDNGACGVYAAKLTTLVLKDNIIRNNGQSGVHLSSATADVWIDDVTCSGNYKHGDRPDATFFGYDAKYNMDILALNDPAQNHIGRNYYQ